MIEFKHVSKTYPNGVEGLKDVNLQIEQGEFVAIIGLSGAGKSTLIRTTNRMIDITEGQLIVDGVDVMTLKGKSMRRFRFCKGLGYSVIRFLRALHSLLKFGFCFGTFFNAGRNDKIKRIFADISLALNAERCDTVTGYLRKKRTAHTLYRKSEISVFNGAFMSHVHKFCKKLFRFLGRLFFHYRIYIRRRIAKFCGTCDNNLRFGRISKKFDSHFYSSTEKTAFYIL